MMMKEKSHPWARLKYLYVLPLAAISMVAFAHTEAANNSNGVSEAKITEVSANSQTSGEKYSDSKGPVVSLAKQNDGLNPIIMVDGKVFQGSTDGLDYKNLTAEDLTSYNPNQEILSEFLLHFHYFSMPSQSFPKHEGQLP